MLSTTHSVTLALSLTPLSCNEFRLNENEEEKGNEKGRGTVSNSNDDALARGLYCYRTHTRIESTKQEKQMSEGPLFSLAHLRLRIQITNIFCNHITTNIIWLIIHDLFFHHCRRLRRRLCTRPREKSDLNTQKRI